MILFVEIHAHVELTIVNVVVQSSIACAEVGELCLTICDILHEEIIPDKIHHSIVIPVKFEYIDYQS